MRRWVAILVVVPWALWAVGRTFGLDRVHPLIAIVAFTPYAAVTAPLPLVVAVVLRRWGAALVALAALLLLAIAVAPRSLGAEEEPRGTATVTVMTSNLFGGRADPERVAELVRRRRVDVLVLQELTPQALERLDRAGLRSSFPHRAAVPLPGGTGNGILSRHPVRRIDAWEAPREPAVDVAVPAFGTPVRVRVVHPFPPTRRGAASAWRAHLRALPAPPEHPAVIAGDFNATLDHRTLRGVLDRGWQDAAAEVGEGLRPTWPVDRRVLGLTIDHVLASRDLIVGPVSIHEIAGTDHRAVVARLALARPAS